MKPLIIGIAGGSASGKTSIARRLKEEFDKTNSVVIIREDDYYKDQSEKNDGGTDQDQLRSSVCV